MDLIRRVRVIVAVVCVGGASSVYAQTQESYFNFLLGRHLEGEGDTAGALKALEQAAAGDPKSAEIRAQIAEIRLRQNDLTQAEQAAKSALSLDANNFEGNRILGLVYAQLSVNEKAGSPNKPARARDAVPYLERAAGMAPNDPNLNYQLGQMYVEAGEARKAVQAFRRVVDASPYSTRARLSLAQAQASVKDFQGAIGTLAEIAEDEPSVLGTMGQYQEAAGQFTEAAASYTKVLESQPGNTNLKARRIAALHDAKQYQQAAKFAADAQNQHPKDPRFPWLHARALFRSGDSTRAIQMLEEAAKSFPKEQGIQLELADFYADAGRGADAEKLLRQMLEADPSNPDALNYLGYMLARNGQNLDEAIQLVNRALKSEPDNGAFLDSLGWAHFKRGDLNEAEKYLGAAAAQLPDNSEILDHLGDLYARQGRWQNAIDAWNRALKGGRNDNVDPSVVQKKIDEARSKSGGR